MCTAEGEDMDRETLKMENWLFQAPVESQLQNESWGTVWTEGAKRTETKGKKGETKRQCSNQNVKDTTDAFMPCLQSWVLGRRKDPKGHPMEPKLSLPQDGDVLTRQKLVPFVSKFVLNEAETENFLAAFLLIGLWKDWKHVESLLENLLKSRPAETEALNSNATFNSVPEEAGHFSESEALPWAEMWPRHHFEMDMDCVPCTFATFHCMGLKLLNHLFRIKEHLTVSIKTVSENASEYPQSTEEKGLFLEKTNTLAKNSCGILSFLSLSSF